MTPKPHATTRPRRSTPRARGSPRRGVPSSSRPRTSAVAAPSSRASSLVRLSSGATSRSAPRPLDERRAALVARLGELEGEIASLPDAQVAAGARLAQAEQVRDDVRSASHRVRAAAGRRLRALRRDFDMRGAAVEERRAVLGARLVEVEARLAARPDEEAKARARRGRLEDRQAAIAELTIRLRDRATEVEALAERLQTPPPGAIGGRTRGRTAARRVAGATRTAAEKQLGELRERAEQARGRGGRDPAAARAGDRIRPA